MRRLKEDIKNRTFHKFYLLYGEEEYLKKLYRDALKNALLENSDEINYSYFDGKDADILKIQEIASTLPFTVIIFVEKEIDKRNKLYKYVNKEGIAASMEQMDAAGIKRFIGITLKENGKKMRESTASYFIQQTGSSMSNIINELDKLVSYTYGRDEITKEDIDAVCCVQVTSHIFQMIDYAAAGNIASALKLYSDLLGLRESPMSILYLLTRHFNLLLQIKMLGSFPKSEVASVLKIPPFAAGKYISQSGRFDRNQLKSLLDECIETEYKFKRGILDAQIGVELVLGHIWEL